MTLRDQYATDVESVLLSASDFAEEITYTRRSDSSQITMNALIQRRDVENGQESQHHAFRTARVTVANSVTTGIEAPAEGDRITMAIRPGAAARECRVVQILSSDEGKHQLLVGE